MRFTWDSILLLFIGAIFVAANVPGDVEQRYDDNKGENAKENTQLLAPKKYIGYRLPSTLVTKSPLQLAQNKNFTTLDKIGSNEESVGSALELARYGDNENRMINRMRNDENKNGETKLEPPATLTSVTTMSSIDTGNSTDYRLPDDIEPLEYILKIKLDDENLFHGTVKIRAVVRKSTRRIVLHVDEMKVHGVEVTVGEEMLDVANTSETLKNNFYTINLADDKLVEGMVMSIDIDYTGQSNGSRGGLRRSTYVDDTGKTRWFAVTELAPIGARKMFPCFDEPRFKTSFTLSVSRPANYRAIVSTRLISSMPDSDGNIIDAFEKTDAMSTYLLSLVIGDFKYVVNDANNYTIWATPTAVRRCEYALDKTVSLDKFYREFLEKAEFQSNRSMVALPDYPSKVGENCGLSVYRESEIVRDPENTPITAEQSLIGVISRELSYWWFGTSTSPSSWNHIWLGTGFAIYFQYHGSSSIKPQWRLDLQFVVDQLHSAFEGDARESTHPMTHAVDYSPAEINRVFNDDTLSAKSASVLRMIEKTFGVSMFRNAIRSYETLGFEPRVPDQLSNALQIALDTSTENSAFEMKALMDSWTEQAGYPVVSVKIQGRVAHLVQKRFYSNIREAETSNNQTWWIPITWASNSNSNFERTSPEYWLKEKNGEVQLDDFNEWVIFNVQQSGYYRVNYDPASWERIIKVLKSDDRIRIHPINRAALINDLLILGQAGQLDYATALSATQYLINETDYIPWRAAFNGLAYLNRQFKHKDTFELYKTHVSTILHPIYEKLGFEESSTETHTDRLLRINVVDWACELNIESCITWALIKFAALRYDAAAVPVNLRKTVYCTAIKHGTMNDWNFLRKRYSSTHSAAEKVVIVNALGCSKHGANIERLLSSATEKNSRLRFEDSLRAFSAVYSSSSFGTVAALTFVALNLERLHEYYQDVNIIDSILKGISSAVTTKQLLLQMEDNVNTLREKLTKIGLSSEKYLQTGYETAAWYERYSPAINQWLHRTYNTSDYRLPTNMYPLSYDIYLKPHLNDRDSHFEGHMILKINVTADTSIIVLHAHALRIHSIIPFTELTEYLPILGYTIDKMTDRLTIYVNSVVAAGTELSLEILYSGLICDDMYGFYRSSYIDKNGKTRWLASTQFQPVHARRAFPCFDEPAFKARFTIHIERPNDYQTLSNMRRLASVPSTSPNRTWDSYEQSVPMSTYLVAFVMSDFDSLTNGFGNYTIWAHPETVKLGEYALDVGQKALSFLEKYTGIDNPIEKIDLIAIPDFHSGAMENWGLMTFRDYGLLGNENVTSARLMKYLHTLVAHETVHTWFGNLVTCDWWDHVWLHEGFAEYFQWIAGHYVSPSWKLLQQFVVYEMHPAMVQDASPTRSMNSRVVKPSDIAFDFIPYAKSASLLRMMHHALGKKVFKSALRTYLEERKWKTATPDHLFSAIQFHADRETSASNLGGSFKFIMEQWTNNWGYPVVNASWDRGVLTFAQERFVFDRRNVTVDDGKKIFFWIPVTLTTKSKSNFRSTRPLFSFSSPRANTSLILNEDEWFIVNIQETGYYRVNYDANSWKRIIAGLMSPNFDGIHEINRAQIIDDLFNLARADYVTYDLALSAATYLVEEDNHLAWAAFFEAFNFLYTRTGGRMRESLWNEYVFVLVRKVYRKIGFVDLPEEQHMDRLNREMILRWTCRLEHPECIESALKLYNQWRKIGINRISPNARPAVYCTAMQYGDFSDWQFLWNEYVKTELGSEKVVILKALGCSRNFTTLINYLKLSISSDNVIRDQDVLETFYAVLYGDIYGVGYMLDFLQDNYHELHRYYGGWNGVANIFHRVSPEISTDSELRMFENIVLSMPEDLNEVKDSLLSAVDTAKENLRWVHAHGKKIEDSLKQIMESMNRGDKNSSPMLSSSLALVTTVSYLVLAY